MVFRKDINGLRAIAVIAVVLYHFNPNWMPGGFAGVDVFFVISGYLMTGIIFSKIEKDSFSILDFYIARANRIVPALVVLCLTLLIFGYLYLTLFDFRELGKHAISSLGFFSNIVYWKEAGYFDAASHSKWLLHTWSLSTEWQFYIIYPIVLGILSRIFSLRSLKIIVLITTLLGMIFCIIATYKWPDASYYLLPTRAWEMMLGGVAYLYPFNIQTKWKKVLELIGLILILCSYLFISKQELWPGYLAMIPVLGAFFIIQSQLDDSVFTSNALFQKIGTWSYSIYLWHWPLVVFGFYFSMENWVFIGIPLSILLGFISYTLIEQRRGILIRGKKKSLESMITRVSWGCALGLSIFIYHDSNNYINENPEIMEPLILGHNVIKGSELLFSDANKSHYLNGATENDFEFLVVGDSNIAHYAYGISQSNRYKVLLSWVGSCLNLPDYTTAPYAAWMDDKWLTSCRDNYQKLLFYSSKDIILGHQWSERSLLCVSNECNVNASIDNYYKMLSNQLSKMVMLIGSERKLYIVGQVPAPKKSMVLCMKKADRESCVRRTSEFNGERVKQNDFLQRFSEQYINVYFINPFSAVCNDSNQCKTIVDDKNLFFDEGHLSAYGSSTIWRYIEKQIEKTL
ncbi:MAG: acyltransferase [Aliivibrio sp.]|uniref:acyltransferase family protein n=1 Tax=Aliivibrio sp. TaxID=1872443 RepID=UPI001A5F31B7|nr:acyltransferase [Aliivibrio sp.]